MVYDMEYRGDRYPMHNFTPIRHQMLWLWIKQAMGEEYFKEELKRLAERQKEDPEDTAPIPTNPQLFNPEGKRYERFD